MEIRKTKHAILINIHRPCRDERGVVVDEGAATRARERRGNFRIRYLDCTGSTVLFLNSRSLHRHCALWSHVIVVPHLMGKSSVPVRVV